MRVALAAAIPLIFAVLLADQVMPPVVSQVSLEALLVPIPVRNAYRRPGLHLLPVIFQRGLPSFPFPLWTARRRSWCSPRWSLCVEGGKEYIPFRKHISRHRSDRTTSTSSWRHSWQGTGVLLRS